MKREKEREREREREREGGREFYKNWFKHVPEPPHALVFTKDLPCNFPKKTILQFP